MNLLYRYGGVAVYSFNNSNIALGFILLVAVLDFTLVLERYYYRCNNYMFFKVCFCVDAWA